MTTRAGRKNQSDESYFKKAARFFDEMGRVLGEMSLVHAQLHHTLVVVGN